LNSSTSINHFSSFTKDAFMFAQKSASDKSEALSLFSPLFAAIIIIASDLSIPIGMEVAP
jgi:hypothetical protein